MMRKTQTCEHLSGHGWLGRRSTSSYISIHQPQVPAMSYPRLPTWSEKKQIFPKTATKVLQLLLSKYISLHDSFVRFAYPITYPPRVSLGLSFII